MFCGYYGRGYNENNLCAAAKKEASVHLVRWCWVLCELGRRGNYVVAMLVLVSYRRHLHPGNCVNLLTTCRVVDILQTREIEC